MTILVTGAAGFIGFHLCLKLLELEIKVIGIDNLNNYYDPSLKKARLNQIKLVSSKKRDLFIFLKADLTDKKTLDKIFTKYKPTKVVNLAAQAGVRYSIENPSAYLESNLIGFGNILETCKNHKIENLLYASSSSVYGGNESLPFSENDNVDHPVSLYAATKKANEMMAHAYSHLFNINSTGLRFFTVYGPWGRPDMALFLFTKAILDDRPIKVFNNGNMIRDFTYIDDIIESLLRLLDKPAQKDPYFDNKNPSPAKSWAPHRVFNIGNSNPTKLMDYIESLELALNKKAKKIFLPLQPGDVAATSSDSSALEEWIGYKPKTSIKTGVNNFVNWYLDFYKK